MKKLFVIFLAFLLVAPVFAQTRGHNLTELTSFLSAPSDSVMFIVFDKSSGSWAAKKGHWDDLVTAMRDSLLTDEDIAVNSIAGDGSALTGIASGTGGITNTGSTTIEADSDSDNSGQIALQTKGSTRLTVDTNDGYIGIGDTGPDAMLEIAEAGDVPFMISNGASGDGDFMKVDASGNVGIGTASSSNKLHVNEASGAVIGRFQGTTNASIYIQGGNTGDSYLLFGDAADDDVGAINYDHTTNSMRFTVNTSETMRIDNSGNVGIGVTDPDELLELYKVGTQLKLSGGAADYATFAVAADGALTITTVDADAAEGDIILMPDGNVGIGTTAPDKALEINSATGANLRLTYNDADGSATYYTDFSTTSSGGLSISAVDNIIDLNGAYLVSTQNIPDLVAGAGKTAYRFDGTDDYIQVSDNATIDDIFDNGGAVFFTMHPNSDGENDAGMLFEKNTGYLNVTGESGGVCYIRLLQNFSTTDGYWTSSVRDIAINSWNSVAVNYNNGATSNDPAMWVNGETIDFVENVAPEGARVSDNGSDMYIGNFSSGNFTFDGEVSRALFFNLELTESEIQALSSGAPVPYKYIGASQTEIASGSLTVGKRYRITAQDGEDFTADGAASNDVGTEFTATGTNVTLDANDKVRQIGCVAQYEPDGITATTWHDASGNALDGTVSGAAVTNPQEELYVVGSGYVAGDLTVGGTVNYAADAQADDDYEISLPGVTALTAGLTVTFIATTANTDGATLEITEVGDVDALVIADAASVSTALATGEILAGQVVTAVFDGTNWQVTSRLANDRN